MDLNGVFGQAESNTIGGILPGAGNLISGNAGVGIQISTNNNKVQGNFIGTDVTGTSAVPNIMGVQAINVFGNVIGGDDDDDGTLDGVVHARNIISGNSQDGVSIGYGITVAQPNFVQGNFIGTDVTGTIAIGNSSGVEIGGEPSSNIVGGPAAGAGNLISGNADGVRITGGQIGNVLVQGNRIGTQADGVTPLGNSGFGIVVNETNNTIGGSGPGEGNVIAFNGAAGVYVAATGQPGTANAILSNSIFSNAGLGIDLLGDRVTPNDPDDADTGPNNLQNFPTIAAVTVSGGNVTISGALNSGLSTAYRLEFYANDMADASGFGEGQTFLGFADVTTDTFGNAVFDVSFPFAGSVNTVTATATDPSGNTSEFSHAFGIKLQNISTRLNVLAGENVLIGGFIITGDNPKQVIVRAIGPSLSISGGVLEDPVLELHEADGSVVTNDNWKDSQQSEIEATGLSPSDDLESAIVANLAPGAYTAIVSGKNNGVGVALVEAYDLDQTLGPILANISTRGFVDTGDNVMIGGFIVGPTDTGIADILVRGIGPSLGAFDIANPLLDPILELHDGNGTLLTTNDNWKDTQQTEIEATGLQPSDDNESAILQTLAPGAYTAILRGVNDTTGVGLVEVYNLANTL